MKITEQHIFGLIDGNITEQEKSEVLKNLSAFPEMESLYRSLLMTEGYIKAHAVEKPTSDFTDRLTFKLAMLARQKKRNGILYTALSLVGVLTVLSFIGMFFFAGNSTVPTNPLVDPTAVTSVLDQISNTLSISAGIIQNLLYIGVAFTFFIFMDRVLINRFRYGH
ncbi:MAG: hypothetical protein RJQ09_17390 [Cyclobacteriaceae bacterium]